MIKLSLNSPEVSKQQNAVAPAFSSALAAAVEAATYAQPEQISLAQAAVKKQPKQTRTAVPSNGLLSRGVQWLQQRGRSKKRLHMIETVSLGEKRFVALVKVDGREFLLGGAPSSVGMLADLGAHGLGELLSVATPIEATAEPQTLPLLTPVPSPVIAAAPKIEVPAVMAKAETVESLASLMPVAAAQPVQQVSSEIPSKLNVIVEADEDESDWLLEDEMGDMLKSAVEMEPSSRPRVSTEPVVSLKPEPVHAVPLEKVEKLGPVAVATPLPTLPSALQSRTDLNFTFQMWPAASSSAVGATETATAQAGSLSVAHRAKTHIDLEACPELLGEPYVLALLDGPQGVAA